MYQSLVQWLGHLAFTQLGERDIVHGSAFAHGAMDRQIDPSLSYFPF